MSPFLKGTQNLGKKVVQQINCKNAFLPSYYEKNAFHKILGKCSSILIYLHCSEMFEFSRQKSYFASVDFLFHICYILLRFCPHPSLFLQTITSAKVLWLLSLASIKLISVPFLVGCSSSGFCDAMIVKFGVLGLGRNTFLALLGVKLMSWGRRCGLGLLVGFSTGAQILGGGICQTQAGYAR